MTQADISYDILQHVGGVTKHNLNEIMRCSQFRDEDFPTIIARSPYYDNEGFDSLLIQNLDKFSILSINIQSINAKFDDLSSLIAVLADKNFYFSAICIQETWLTQNSDTSHFILPGYKLISRGKTCTGHGGLITYIHDKFNFTIRDLCPESDIWEGLFVDIYNEDINKKVTLCNIYRPPKRNDCNAILESFNSELRPIISSLANENSHCIFTGDFNIDLLKVNERIEYQEYFYLFVTNSFLPNIVLPTRLSRHNATLIDQIFSKTSSGSNENTSGILLSNMSDHLPYFCLLDILTKPAIRTPKYVRVNRNHDDSLPAFSVDVENNMTNCSFDNGFGTNPKNNLAKFHGILSKARQNHLEPIITKFNKYKHKLNPWMTNGILHSLKFRDNLYRKLKSLKPDSDTYKAMEINLKTYRTILRRSIRLAKINYYGQLFEKSLGDIKRTWSIINGILNRNKKSSGFAKYFIIDGEKISDPQVIANKFNSFFANVGPSLSNNIKCNSTKSVKSYLKMTITSSFSFKTVNASEVLKVIQELKNKTSFGHDNISTKILKAVAHILIDPLTLIINQSLTTGIFPCVLKIARVIPLFKKDDEHILGNYRPISLLTSVSKVSKK